MAPAADDVGPVDASEPPEHGEVGEGETPRGTRTGRRLGTLVVARLVDQGALGVASILLARELGPAAFAPVAILFIVNSLVIQVADLGLSLAIMRTPPHRRVARRSLSSIRRVGAGVFGAALVVAVGLAAVDQNVAAVVAVTSGALWPLAAEARVRKAGALTSGAVGQAAGAEIVGAVAFFVGSVVAAFALDGLLVAVCAVIVGKHIVELLFVRRWSERFDEEGQPARSGPEWMGQIATYMVANADYLVLGLLLSPIDLSRYAVAFRVASAIPSLVGSPVTQSAFLDLVSAGPSERQQVHDGIARRVLQMGWLGATGVFLSAPLLPVVLGEGWAGTGSLMAILGLAVPFRLLLGMSVAQAIVVGRARAVVGWECARLVAVVVTTAGAAALGGLVWGTVAVSVVTIASITTVYVLASGAAEVRPRRGIVPMAVAASAAAVVSGIVFS